MRKQLGRQQAGAKGPASTQQAKEQEAAEDALRARSVGGSPEAVVAAVATTTDDRPGARDGGSAGDTGEHQAGSQKAGDDEGAEAPGENATEGGKESGGGEEPAAPGTAAGGGAGEGADAASPSVDPQEVLWLLFSSIVPLTLI